MKKLDSIIDKFKNQHIIVKALDIIFIIVFVYGIITMNILSIVWILLILLVLLPICKWLLENN